MIAAVALVAVAGAILPASGAHAVPGRLAVPHSDVRTPARQSSAAEQTALLTSLAAASPRDVPAFVADQRHALEDATQAPAVAHTVSPWWTGLDDAERATLVQHAPAVVGDLPGVPYAARARANAVELARDIRDDRRAIRRGGDPTGSHAARLAMLEQVRTALTPSPGGPPRSLVAFDPSDGGIAAVAVGDLASADRVAVLVPGMFFDVDAQIVDWTATAERIATGADSPAPPPPGSVAAIAWIGYRTPGLTDVTTLSLADHGADALQRELTALAVTRESDEPFTTVIAHSYGSTVALLALQRHMVHVDALVLVGTPGSDARTASQLDVDRGGVYVGEASLDPIAGSRFFGADPASPAYGATRFATGAGRDPVDGRPLGDAVGHNGYLVDDTQSIRNIELVAAGRADLVTRADPDAAPVEALSDPRGLSALG